LFCKEAYTQHGVWSYASAGRCGFYKKVKPLLPEKVFILMYGTACLPGGRRQALAVIGNFNPLIKL
jgi:hypothetical protein